MEKEALELLKVLAIQLCAGDPQQIQSSLMLRGLLHYSYLREIKWT